MKKYDVVVVGGGSGSHIVDVALQHDYSVCFIEKDRLGGTCLNYGCIPTKLLTYPADIVSMKEKAEKLKIEVNIEKIDFKYIMERMRKKVKENSSTTIKNLTEIENLDFHNKKARFIDNYKLKVDGQIIKGDKIFLATGARANKPPIKGIDEVKTYTNETILNIEEKPSSIIIIGGGYISIEYAHFFNSMGTDVTILQRNKDLIPNMDHDIKKILKQTYNKKLNLHTNTTAREIKKINGEKKVTATKNDEEKEFTAELVLVATGRKSNADLLNLQHTDIETDQKNYIKVNKKMETTQPNVWAIGDATGKHMFKHTANREANIASENAFHQTEIEMNYTANPKAIYSNPQIASVGLTEKQAKQQHDILIGEARYNEVAKGQAMEEKTGYVKTIVKKESKEILGHHIIGPHAPTLIQEIITVMAAGGNPQTIFNAMHIHPALPEINLEPFTKLKPP
ncbi:Pyruvate/2-oxoglutarate dehydrogenase complex (E3) component Lpd [Methanonatronarchaeum thermophilum]|uniref:Pyruvate/2-oxoglutarate dehydrogenase complex (E3) component Lpd n=1 Tax=Methanonatronarchaeum thermophilum TaxID=1927129 RepID=A0A1Y3GDM0_9EURY|nr:dihydrolipoyl dehydrogenase [Methanonatronarchaeum thermophilum]OUJ19538.1 Pyruvate/2-oxoglutarate dehydrogenase complex (E3) component Lpd [Methanonatronarchaeum thermophilum]